MDETWVKELAEMLPNMLSEAVNKSLNNLVEIVSADETLCIQRNAQAPAQNSVAGPPAPTPQPAPPPTEAPPPHTPVTPNQASRQPPPKKGPGPTIQNKPSTNRQPPQRKPPEPSFNRRQPARRIPHNPNPPHAPAVANLVDDEWEQEAPLDEEEQSRRLMQYAITNKHVRYFK